MSLYRILIPSVPGSKEVNLSPDTPPEHSQPEVPHKGGEPDIPS